MPRMAGDADPVRQEREHVEDRDQDDPQQASPEPKSLARPLEEVSQGDRQCTRRHQKGREQKKADNPRRSLQHRDQ